MENEASKQIQPSFNATTFPQDKLNAQVALRDRLQTVCPAALTTSLGAVLAASPSP